MDVGITIPHTGRLASPALVREYCITAEQVGFDSLWGVDHMVMPHHTDSQYTLGRRPAEDRRRRRVGVALAELRDDDHPHVGRRLHQPGEARDRGRRAADPQRGAQCPPTGHARRLLGGPRRLRRGRRLAPGGGRGHGHAVGPSRRPQRRAHRARCGRCGPPTATSSSSTAGTTTSHRSTRSPGRCSGRSRS